MKIKNSFLKKVGIYFIGTVSTKMLSVILVPMYAYFVLPEDLGQYDYILALANIIAPIIYLLIWEAVLRYCIKEDNPKIMKIKIATVVSFFVVISLVVLVGSVIYYLCTKKVMIILLMLLIVGYGGASLWQFSARAFNENKRYVIAGVVGSAAVVIIDLLCIFFYKLDFVALSIANVISQLLIILLIEKKIKLFSYFAVKEIDWSILKQMIVFSAPLAINNVSLWANTGGCKIIVQNNVGIVESGLYSFASKFSILISLFSMVISMAVTEEAYSSNNIVDYRKKMTKIIERISKVYFSLIYLAIPAIYILYSLVFKSTEYFSSVNYIVFLLLGALFTALSTNYGSAFQVTDTTKYISITTIIGAIFTLTISLILSNEIGIYGVLTGGVIGPFMMMLTRAIYAKKVTGLCISWKKNILFLVLITIECMLLSFFQNMKMQLLCLILAIIVCIIEYRKELIQIKCAVLRMMGSST